MCGLGTDGSGVPQAHVFGWYVGSNAIIHSGGRL